MQNWEQKACEPANPKKWYQAYKKLLMDSQKEVEDDAAELKATMDRIKQDQALHKAQQVELKGVKFPEGMKSKGPTISLSIMPKFYEKPSYPPPNPNPRKRKPTQKIDVDDPDDPNYTKDPDKVFVSNNKGKLAQFRKEAKAMSHFKPSARPGIWTAKDMTLRRGTTNRPVITAPRILIEEHRKAAIPAVLDPSVKPGVIFTPKTKRVRPDETVGLTTEERERRLKAFTKPSSAIKATSDLGASTSPRTSYATSPPNQKAEASTPTASKLAKLPASNAQAIPHLSSPLKRKDGGSPPLGHAVPRANTSSPSNGGCRPPMSMKKKAPVDVFMPAKRRKIA